MTFCTKCGNRLADEDVFCPGCGTVKTIPSAAPAIPVPPPSYPPPQTAPPPPQPQYYAPQQPYYTPQTGNPVKQTKYPPFGFPADSKLPMIAGIITGVSILRTLISAISYLARNASVAGVAASYLPSLLTSVLFLVLVLTAAKKKPGLMAISFGWDTLATLFSAISAGMMVATRNFPSLDSFYLNSLISNSARLLFWIVILVLYLQAVQGNAKSRTPLLAAYGVVLAWDLVWVFAGGSGINLAQIPMSLLYYILGHAPYALLFLGLQQTKSAQAPSLGYPNQ
ncbi:MAG: zinc ribbon domain-containing protein [Oscillospiraceae bacterium]|jgi:hypothetical protein|nr:zinc ribbon domain-containing protein [Oscillospiraceae bacterium]